MADKVVTLTLSKDFATFLESVHRQHNIPQLAASNAINLGTIALDPGETTGWATFDGDVTVKVGQAETKSVIQGATWFRDFLADQPGPLGFTHLRVEDYRIYEWKSADHSWSQVHTLRWIGAIQLIANDEGLDLSFCMAQHAKGFWTDAKLKHFNLYPSGLRHGKDALRHLLYYMLYPTKVDQ